MATAEGAAQDTVGGRLRELRRQHSLSLKGLAERSDVAIGSLSQIERGLTQPSIRTLQKVAAAVGVPLSWFFEPRDAEEDGVVVRAGSGALLATKPNGIVKTLLTPHDLDALQLMLVRIDPGASSGAGVYTHAGLDAGTVLGGSLNLEVDGRVYVLGPGDSFGFDSGRPHRFENRGAVPAEIVWINTQRPR